MVPGRVDGGETLAIFLLEIAMLHPVKGQHFLLSAAARTVNLAQVLRLSETEAEMLFAKIRWPETAGRAVCPHCGCGAVYDCRRPTGRRWRLLHNAAFCRLD